MKAPFGVVVVSREEEVAREKNQCKSTLTTRKMHAVSASSADAERLMRGREASINGLAISEPRRKFRWPAARLARPRPPSFFASLKSYCSIPPRLLRASQSTTR
ncbi:MAG: hypothetical protein JNL18_22530 [Planctomycetaceae bacterium]|nr:hypothetical protein [Planctomycetaceae bacterium]